MITISFAENKHNAVGYRGITAKLDSVPALSPQNRNPLPRYYRNVSPHFRGSTAVTAVIPLSPLPCSSLFYIPTLDSAIGHLKLLDHGCRTNLRQSDLTFSSSARC